MALYVSSLTSTTPVLPAKNLISNGSILRSSCVILHHPSSTTSLSSKPVSARVSPNLLMATPAQKYEYPEPVPEFAVAETHKFRDELVKNLYKDKETFGDDLEIVEDVFAEPFTDMFVALNEKKLPGAPIAAQLSLL